MEIKFENEGGYSALQVERYPLIAISPTFFLFSRTSAERIMIGKDCIVKNNK